MVCMCVCVCVSLSCIKWLCIMNNWFLFFFNSHCLDNLLKCPFDLTRQNNGLWASIIHSMKFSIKTVIAILLYSHFCVPCPSEFTILLHAVLCHHLPYFMFYFLLPVFVYFNCHLLSVFSLLCVFLLHLLHRVSVKSYKEYIGEIIHYFILKQYCVCSAYVKEKIAVVHVLV